MTGTTYRIFYRRNAKEPWKSVGEIRAYTGYEAVNMWMAAENNTSPLTSCDIAAVADWGFYVNHFEAS